MDRGSVNMLLAVILALLGLLVTLLILDLFFNNGSLVLGRLGSGELGLTP